MSGLRLVIRDDNNDLLIYPAEDFLCHFCERIAGKRIFRRSKKKDLFLDVMRDLVLEFKQKTRFLPTHVDVLDFRQELQALWDAFEDLKKKAEAAKSTKDELALIWNDIGNLRRAIKEISNV